MQKQDWFTELLDNLEHPARVRKAAVYAVSGAALMAAHYFGAGIVYEMVIFIGGLFGLYQVPNQGKATTPPAGGG